MKHYFHNILTAVVVAAAGAVFTSCGDFLEIKPRDIVTEDNFWNEKADVEQMVRGCYTAMQSNSFIERCVVWGEGRSENLYPSTTLQKDNYHLYQIMRENLLPSNVYTTWVDFYYVINKCNTVIKMAPIVSEKDPAYRSSDVKATIAEMTALRSLCYFYLIRTFDEVPFYRDAVQQENEVLRIPASSFDFVLGEIIHDLDSVKSDAILHYATKEGEDYVGEDYYSNANRITRTAINAMLADMYLWSGDYAKAAACADEVLEQKKKDYEEYFSNRSASMLNTSVPRLLTAPYGTTAYLYQASENNPSAVFDAIFGTGNSFESIFELSFNYTGEGSPYAQSAALGSLYGNNLAKDGNNGAGLLRPNSNIVAEANDGVFGGFWLNRYDTRFYNSLQATDSKFSEGYVRKGVAGWFNLNRNSGDNRDKLLWNNISRSDFYISPIMDRNWIFYRLTDVMLLKAEALWQQLKDDGSDEDNEIKHQIFDLLYLVNTRSVGSASSNNYLRTNQTYATNVNQLRDLIRDERNRELIFEGKRWFDLLRYARRDGNPQIVRGKVTTKVSGSGRNGFPSMDALFWPYNKDELKVNTYLSQKPIYAKVDDGDDDD